MAPRAGANEGVSGAGDFPCECGRTFAYGGAYTKHKLKCDGKPATSRIAGGTGTPPKPIEAAIVPPASTRPITTRHVGGRPRKPVHDAKTARRRESYRKSARKKRGHVDVMPAPNPSTALATIAAAATDKATEIVIAGLMAKRAAIDTAIAALQAVS